MAKPASRCPARSARRGRKKIMLSTTRQQHALHHIFLAILLLTAGLLWEATSRLGIVRPLLLPSPTTVLNTLVTELQEGALTGDILVSLLRLGSGWCLGTVAGLIIGIVMGISPSTRYTFRPLISALFAIPKIALLPLFILWFGIGETAKIMTIAIGVFFPTVISVWTGINTTPASLQLMARSYQLPQHLTIRYILLPAALPAIIAGFRISISLGIVLLVAAEMLGTERGIGAYILTAGSLVQTDKLLAGVMILSVFGLISGSGINLLEHKLLRNHPSQSS